MRPKKSRPKERLFFVYRNVCQLKKARPNTTASTTSQVTTSKGESPWRS